MFLDVTPLIACCGERGLLSVAFHPRYAENGLFFVDYTNTGGHIVVARYRVSPANPDAADPASGVVLLTIPHPEPNHNGGQLQFGPDGYLYVGTGDGGSADDPPCNAQRDDTLLGKILRLDVDQSAASPPYYGIPPSNPFVSRAGARGEIWAKGLRNPWRFSFDRATGDLRIGDVGQTLREEVDFQPAASPGGEKYGWKLMEGSLCGGGGGASCPEPVPECAAAGLVRPVLEYSHVSGSCAVTGGYVYRGSRIPELSGRYLYGDFCSGRIWADGEPAIPFAPGLTTFGEDLAGELYVATEGGALYRIVNANPARSTVVPAPRRSVTPRVVARPF